MARGYRSKCQDVCRVNRRTKSLVDRIFLLVFCSNPGPLDHGRIYVVIRDERVSPLPIRSEFRSYIPTVIHGRTIEFECNTGEDHV